MTTRRDEAARLRAQGLTFQQIGQAMGISAQRAHRLLVEPGAPSPAVISADEVILRHYLDGLTDADVARELGVSVARVKAARKRAGVRGRRGFPPNLTPQEVERMVSLAKAGATNADLGARFGLAAGTVGEIVINAGLRRALPRSGELRRQVEARVLALRREGRSVYAICKALKCAPCAVNRILKAHAAPETT